MPLSTSATLAARFEHEIGIMRDKASMRAIVMHAREHVDVDEALVNGRNQRVGKRMRKPHQAGIACRRIDHHEFVGMLDRRDCFGERGEFHRFVIAHIIGSAAIERMVQRQLDRRRRRLRPGAAVLQKTRQRPLAYIEIDRGDAITGLQKRDRDVDRQRRLAGAALLVAEDDHMRASKVRRLEMFGHQGNGREEALGIAGESADSQTSGFIRDEVSALAHGELPDKSRV